MSAPLVYGPHAPAAAARSKKPLLVAGLAMVMVVGAVVIGVVSTSNSPKVPGAGVAPAAFVVSSTQATLSKHTAEMVLSGSISVKGQTIPIQGTGQIDFDSNAASATASMSISSHSLVEHEVVTGGAFYMGLNVDGQSMSVLTGGPNWVDVPLPDQGSLGAGNFDPLKQIQLAEQKGAKVVPLGTSSVNGATVSGYAITPSRDEIFAAIEQEVNSGALTQADANEMFAVSRRVGSYTSDLYIDGNDLLRQVVVNLGDGTSGATGKVVEDLQNFGTPVHIEAPASSDVISFSKFLQDTQSTGASLG